MKFLKYFGMALCLALLVAAASPRVRADAWNQLTYVTFSGPVEIPAFHGPRVLPAGTYEFKLLNTLADRNIVQIYNKNGTHLFATIVSVPDHRMQPAGHTVINFAERAEGSPPAIRAWFYPGNTYGQEFVYPRSRAIELARANHEAVLSMPDNAASNMNQPIHSANDASAKALGQAPLTAEQPNGQEVQASSVVQNSPSHNTTTQQHE